jgi:Tfp pilus assembly protein PilN
MTRFTFLQSPERSLLERLREIDIDRPTRKALSILSVAVGLLVFGCGVEQIRLAQAHALERDSSALLRQDERSILAMRAAAETVAKLATLAHSVRDIHQSGERKAAELTEIAARLPEHVWLTSIREDQEGLLIQGGAQSYARVGLAMSNLERAERVRTPILISSSMLDALHPDAIAYEMHLEEHGAP